MTQDPARPRIGPTAQEFAAEAWKLQQRVNQWFRDNQPQWSAVDHLSRLGRRNRPDAGLMFFSDPDANWYTKEGEPQPERTSDDILEGKPFWKAVEPLFDFLHRRYGVPWTYSVLMLHATPNFRGTPTDLGIGDHFSAREDVVFTNGPGSEVRTGWHANQFPPFLVQQNLHKNSPFETISTYALNIRYLTDALPLTITRLPEDFETHASQWRLISVSRFDELFAGGINDLVSLVEGMKHCYSSKAGWNYGGKEALASHFAKLDEEALAILKPAGGDLFRILQGGPDAESASQLEYRLRRPDGTNLALAKYLILMTAVWPEWTRITMIPHRVPIFTHPQPGGIVICEDKRSIRINAADLICIGDLVSSGIWPWVSLQSTERGESNAAIRNAALLGKALRHELNNSLGLIDGVVTSKHIREKTPQSSYDSIASDLQVVACALDGLAGLEDLPEAPKLERFEKMFTRLRDAFRLSVVGEISIAAPPDTQVGLPRLYYIIFVELIRNAGKRRVPNDPPIEISAARSTDETLRVEVSNVGSTATVDETVQRVRNEWQNPGSTSVAGTEKSKEGIGLVVALVRHARGEIAARTQIDEHKRTWLVIGLNIPI